MSTTNGTCPDLDEWERLGGGPHDLPDALTYRWAEGDLAAMVYVISFQPAYWAVVSAEDVDPQVVVDSGSAPDGEPGALDRMAAAAWAALQLELTGCAECRGGAHGDCLRPRTTVQTWETGEHIPIVCCTECVVRRRAAYLMDER